MRVRFGEFLLETETRQLLRGSESVHLSPKAFQLLELLVDKRPRALAKPEIHRLLWPKTFVSDAALTGLVAEIRAALQDDARVPRWIRTVPVFGYSFCGQADVEALSAGTPGARVFRLVWQSREIQLAPGENVLGRGPESAVWIDDESVSRRHARIHVQGDSAVLEDLSSKNGTFLGGKRLTGPEELRDGDEIRFGTVAMRWRVFAGQVSTTSVAPD